MFISHATAKAVDIMLLSLILFIQIHLKIQFFFILCTIEQVYLLLTCASYSRFYVFKEFRLSYCDNNNVGSSSKRFL